MRQYVVYVGTYRRRKWYIGINNYLETYYVINRKPMHYRKNGCDATKAILLDNNWSECILDKL